MEQWKIKNDILEFDDGTHTYYVNGVKVPSITQILKLKFNTKYEDIDPEILKKAGERGTMIHALIEVYEKLGIEDKTNKYIEHLDNYKKLKKAYFFECLENEIPIILKYKDFVCAGRLDLVLKEIDDIGLGDIKTTYALDLKYLEYQLNLYRLGYQQCYDKEISFLRGVYLRNNTKKYVKIPINEKLVIDLLEEYIYFQF